MRLIDADALKMEFPKDEDWDYPVNTNSFICELIDEQPTIEPERKKGKWEYHSNPNIRGGMDPEDAYCSVCGFHVCTSEVDDFDNYNFCPNCGADMRSESVRWAELGESLVAGIEAGLRGEQDDEQANTNKENR